jgi:hypothetical protein
VDTSQVNHETLIEEEPQGGITVEGEGLTLLIEKTQGGETRKVVVARLEGGIVHRVKLLRAIAVTEGVVGQGGLFRVSVVEPGGEVSCVGQAVVGVGRLWVEDWETVHTQLGQDDTALEATIGIRDTAKIPLVAVEEAALEGEGGDVFGEASLGLCTYCEKEEK